MKNYLDDLDYETLVEILSFGKVRLSDELERKKLSIDQSSINIVVITLLLTFLAMIYPEIKNYNIFNNNILITLLFTIIGISFITLILSIFVGLRRSYQTPIITEELINNLIKDNQKITRKNIIISHIIAQEDFILSINKNSKKRSFILSLTHILMSLIIILIFIFLILSVM